jgi:hypothetical protein
MRKLIIKLLFGNDELALCAFELVARRREVLSLQKQRQNLGAKLSMVRERLIDKAIEVDDARADYFDARHSVEVAANKLPL